MLSSMLFHLIFILLVLQCKCIHSTSQIEVFPNTKQSPANFILHFQLDQQLMKGNYLMIVFTSFQQEVKPQHCSLVDSIITVSQCVNLFSTSTLKINQTWVNTLNPNINTTKTIVLRFDTNLSPKISYSVQTKLQNLLPNIVNTLTSNFQTYTISNTGVMLQQNWNFGKVNLQSRLNKNFNVRLINSISSSYPGTQSVDLQLQIIIGTQCVTSQCKLLFVVSGQFSFLSSSMIRTLSVISTPPIIHTQSVISRSILIATFNESFVVGRKFRINVTNINNPLTIATGYLSIYSLPYNSIDSIQMLQNSIQISTVPYNPTLAIDNANSLPSNDAIQFYRQKEQYIQVKWQMPYPFQDKFVIQLRSDNLIFHEGSIYVETLTKSTDIIVYSYPNDTSVIIKGITSLSTGVEIIITAHVWIPNVATFDIYVSIDEQSKLNSPIIYTESLGVVAIISQNYVSSITDTNSNQVDKITAMKTTTSSFSFTVKPNFQTLSGSQLSIYLNDMVTSSNIQCLVNNTARTCILQNSVLIINQISNQNLFPQGFQTSIIINNLNIAYSSSHSKHIFQLYFALVVSDTSGPSTKYSAYFPTVIPQRAQLKNFQMYISNDLNDSGLNFPNIIRLVATNTSQWTNTIQTDEKRIITLFAYDGWTTLFSTLVSGDTYPSQSNLQGISFTYIKGTKNNISTQHHLNWDRINIILPGAETSENFNIIFPTNFKAISSLKFELAAGIYNINSKQINYLQLNNRITRTASNVQISNKPKQSKMQIFLAGKAGAYANNITLTLVPSGTYDMNQYSAAIMIASDWALYDHNSALSSSTFANPSFINSSDMLPMYLNISSTRFLTYIPLKNNVALTSTFNISINGIKFPYTHDLPYYSIFLVDASGSINSYNQFINQNQNAFYSTHLSEITIQCNDSSFGVTNTFCDIKFITNNQINIQAKIYVSFTGLLVSTDTCKLFYDSNQTQISLSSCVSSTNHNELIISLDNSIKLPNQTRYKLQINGISILNNTISHYIVLTVRDHLGSYIIETGTRILMIKVSSTLTINIQQIFYLKDNPIVISGILLNFTLPRKLYDDESFAIVMSNDLGNLNTIPSKFNIKLFFKSTAKQIENLKWIFNTQNSQYQIIFQSLNPIIQAGSYSIEIYGIKMPSDEVKDIVSLIYLRNYDKSFTVTQPSSSTVKFPSLSDKVNSLITFQSLFNTQGLEQQLIFTIIAQHVSVDSASVWIINLPRYYFKSIWDNNQKTYCKIQSSNISCSSDVNTPYQIKLWNSPQSFSIGTTYRIYIYGIVCPRKKYVNGNSLFVTQSIFFAMSINQTSSSYIQYSQLFITANIINPEDESGYGVIMVQSVTSTNMEVLKQSYVTILLQTTRQIDQNDWIYLTFPAQFDNFNDLNISVEVVSQNIKNTYNTQTINTRLGFQLSMTNIPIGSFTINIPSLLTPSSPSTIDMNKLHVMIVTSDKLSSKSTSHSLSNIANSLTFITSSLHIVINNYKKISIIAGTFSQPIQIRASDSNNFQSNVKINFISDNLLFKPSNTLLYLGNQFGTFIVGSHSNLIPTIYSFQISKTQTSISSFYTSLDKYIVEVSKIPVQIIIPSTINIPLGGCSLPYKIQLKNSPYSDVEIRFEYNSQLYNLNLFWLNQQTSYSTLEFNENITQRWLSFCCNIDLTLNSFLVNVTLSGTNQQAYLLSTQSITINIISNSSTIKTPQISLVVSNVQKTYALIKASTNIDGSIYYQLKINNQHDSSTSSLLQLKSYAKTQQTIIETQTDFLTKQIYLYDRDHRVNLITSYLGINDIRFQNLLPEREYIFCAFLENQHRISTLQSCITLKTQNWGLITKASLTFTQTILQNQLNDVLCFFVKSSVSKIGQIIDLQGKSCSLSNSAANYNFLYNGFTQSKQLTQTIIYHISDFNQTTDVSSSNFESLYSNNVLSDESLSLALSKFSVNFIKSSIISRTFNPISAINMESDIFKPEITYNVGMYISNSISLTDFKLNYAGSVYIILTYFKSIQINQLTGHADLQIRKLQTPTSEQILNCKNGYNQTPLKCLRVVLEQNQMTTVIFEALNENTVYMIYYVIANEYPLRPIIYGQVSSQQISTINYGYILSTSVLLLISFMIM